MALSHLTFTSDDRIDLIGMSQDRVSTLAKEALAATN